MIKKVDFYILETNLQQSLFFVCKLVEKTYLQKQNAYIHVDSLELAKRLDDLLWTYREDSFIPHLIYQKEVKETNNLASPIQILIGEKFELQKWKSQIQPTSIVINLSERMPHLYPLANHIIEIVFKDVEKQQLARERYRHYRQQGCDIHTYKE